MQSSEQKCLFISASNWFHTWNALLTTWARESAMFRTKLLIYFCKQLISYMDGIINNLIKRECKVQKQSSEQKCWFISASNWFHTWNALLTTWARESRKFRTKMLTYFRKQLISYMDAIINNLIKRECKVRKQSSKQKRWFISTSNWLHTWMALLTTWSRESAKFENKV